MTTIIAAAAHVDALGREIPAERVVTAASATRDSLPAAIWLEELAPAEVAHLETVLGDEDTTSVAVHSERWDGFTPLPLADRVRGVIGGFGPAGIRAALNDIDAAREDGSAPHR